MSENVRINQDENIKINGVDELEISDALLKEWQSIVDLIARIAKVRAALIMRLQDQEIEVFVASKNGNHPYKPGNKECFSNSGLYCERVIKEGKMLLVPNASKSEEWKHNPDMKYRMKFYMGFPIRWPNGRFFGTICMLDDKENHFSQDMQDFMEKMRNLIEAYLNLLHLSTIDPLTGLYNRAYLTIKAEKEMKNADVTQKPFSALLMDMDYFKKINDTFGHLTGDQVLKKFA